MKKIIMILSLLGIASMQAHAQEPYKNPYSNKYTSWQMDSIGDKVWIWFNVRMVYEKNPNWSGFMTYELKRGMTARDLYDYLTITSYPKVYHRAGYKFSDYIASRTRSVIPHFGNSREDPLDLWVADEIVEHLDRKYDGMPPGITVYFNVQQRAR